MDLDKLAMAAHQHRNISSETRAPATFNKLPLEIQTIIFNLAVTADCSSALLGYRKRPLTTQQLAQFTPAQVQMFNSDANINFRFGIQLSRTCPLLLVSPMIQATTIRLFLRAVTMKFTHVRDIRSFQNKPSNALRIQDEIRKIVLDTSDVPRDHRNINRHIFRLLDQASTHFRNLESLVVNFGDAAFNSSFSVIPCTVHATHWPKLMSFTVKHVDHEDRVRLLDEQHLELQQSHSLRPGHIARVASCSCRHARQPSADEAARTRMLAQMNTALAAAVAQKNALLAQAEEES